MKDSLQDFIRENIHLINQNTKESWEEIYYKVPYSIIMEFTKTILGAGINDPASIMGCIPKCYLYNDSKIKDYIIPSNVTSIGSNAFTDCSSLTSVVIPDSVMSIGIGAFSGCDSLKEIKFKGTKKEAIQLGIGVESKNGWRVGSAIEKIICIDGVIEL